MVKRVSSVLSLTHRAPNSCSMQSWVVISLNLFVHVVMCKSESFWSSSRCSCEQITITMQLPVVLRFGCVFLFVSYRFPNGVARQWKKYLTTLQIGQFIIDLFVVYFGSKSLLLLSCIEILSSGSLSALCLCLLALDSSYRQLRRDGISCTIGMRLTL